MQSKNRRSEIYAKRDLRRVILRKARYMQSEIYAKRARLHKAKLGKVRFTQSEIMQSQIYAEQDYAKPDLCKARFTPRDLRKERFMQS